MSGSIGCVIKNTAHVGGKKPSAQTAYNFFEKTVNFRAASCLSLPLHSTCGYKVGSLYFLARYHRPQLNDSFHSERLPMLLLLPHELESSIVVAATDHLLDIRSKEDSMLILRRVAALDVT